MMFVVLTCLNMSLIYVCYVALFHDHLYPFMDTKNNELFQENNVIGCKIAQNWVVDHSGGFNNWCHHLPVICQISRHETERKIENIQTFFNYLN